MGSSQSKYSIEIVDPNGNLLADLTGRANTRRLVKSRNEAELIEWSIDLDEFERYCRLLNVSPGNILSVNRNEIRIKRGGIYLAGGQISYYNVNIGPREKTVEVKATGFLNLFSYRYTGAIREFTATEASTIAWTLINESQQRTNGDFGITQGTTVTGATHDRTYRRTNLKDAIQNFGNLKNKAIDHEFTYDKVFNTYSSIGSVRPDIIFEYPGNIKSLEVPNDGTGIANSVIAIGAGFGEQVSAVIIADDTISQSNYLLREKKVIANGTNDDDGGVTDAANSELASFAYPYVIPAIVVDGNLKPYITSYGIGDIVKVKLGGSNLVSHIDGSYRIERYELNIDENDNEEVRIYIT